MQSVKEPNRVDLPLSAPIDQPLKAQALTLQPVKCGAITLLRNMPWAVLSSCVFGGLPVGVVYPALYISIALANTSLPGFIAKPIWYAVFMITRLMNNDAPLIAMFM